MISSCFGVNKPTKFQLTRTNKEHQSIQCIFIHTRNASTQKNVEFPIKAKDIPKFEKPDNLNINVFELERTILVPAHINRNYDQPQTDLLLCGNHYYLITKIQTFGKEYKFSFGVDCVNWFGNQKLELQTISSEYFTTNLKKT